MNTSSVIKNQKKGGVRNGRIAKGDHITEKQQFITDNDHSNGQRSIQRDQITHQTRKDNKEMARTKIIPEEGLQSNYTMLTMTEQVNM